MSLQHAITVTQLLQAAAAILLAWRLLHFRLQTNMRAMVAWQFWTAASSLGAFLLYPLQKPYMWFYMASLPIDGGLMIFAVAELFPLVFARYPGIRTAGRRIMYCSVAFAVTCSLVVATTFASNQNTTSKIVFLMVAKRSTVFSLALFILAVLAILSRYPVRMPRNFSVACSMFCTMFLSEAFVLGIDTLKPTRSNPLLDLAQVLICIVCLGCWAFLLQPEEIQVENRIPSGPESEEQLLLQLDNLNRILSRASRH